MLQKKECFCFPFPYAPRKARTKKIKIPRLFIHFMIVGLVVTILIFFCSLLYSFQSRCSFFHIYQWAMHDALKILIVEKQKQRLWAAIRLPAYLHYFFSTFGCKYRLLYKCFCWFIWWYVVHHFPSWWKSCCVLIKHIWSLWSSASYFYHILLLNVLMRFKQQQNNILSLGFKGSGVF